MPGQPPHPSAVRPGIDQPAVLTRDQVRRVDALAVTRYGMVGLMLMENAGRNAAALIDDTYGPTGSAFIVCGPGNNGGDGFVIARHLANRGWRVRLLLAGATDKLSDDARVNHGVARAMGLPITVAPDAAAQAAALADLGTDDVLVDALLGTGFAGAVRSPQAELIQALNARPRRACVAVDVPSGLDCDTGAPASATIRADLTVTFVATKLGFTCEGSAAYTGRVEVADIGVPAAVIAEVAR